MNKKIKIIELLQDFADEKEIVMPKYIRYRDRIGHKDEVMLVCKGNIINKLDECKIDLNDEDEILEDNTEEIEELPKMNFFELVTDEVKTAIAMEKIKLKVDELVKAVNQIRKDLNK